MTAPLGRVLFVAADLPWPLDGGGRIASHRVLAGFARHASVDLIALADPFRPVDTQVLRNMCETVEVIPHPFTFGLHRARQLGVAARSMLSRDPYRIRKFRSRPLREAISTATRRTDYALIHHEQLGVAQYRDPRSPSTALVQNVESSIYELASQLGGIGGAWARIEGWKLRRAEPAILRGFDGVYTLTDADANALEVLGVRHPMVVPVPAPDVLPRRPPPPEPRILTLGSMSWFGVADGLRWFHDEVFPAIRRAVPAVQWDLVGPGAPAFINGWSGEPGIELHGYVDDIGPIRDAARVAVIPLRVAGGVRIKILDLMAWGVPSVGTTLAATGLGFEQGHGAFRCDDADEFASTVVRLLRDDALHELTTERGRRFIVDHHQDDSLDAALLSGAERAIERHRSRRGQH